MRKINGHVVGDRRRYRASIVGDWHSNTVSAPFHYFPRGKLHNDNHLDIDTPIYFHQSSQTHPARALSIPKSSSSSSFQKDLFCHIPCTPRSEPREPKREDKSSKDA